MFWKDKDISSCSKTIQLLNFTCNKRLYVPINKLFIRPIIGVGNLHGIHKSKKNQQNITFDWKSTLPILKSVLFQSKVIFCWFFCNIKLEWLLSSFKWSTQHHLTAHQVFSRLFFWIISNLTFSPCNFRPQSS